MDEAILRQLLQDVSQGRQTIDQAVARLRALSVQNLGFARLDHHRSLRQGFSEVVYCASKTPEQAAQIIAKLVERHDRVLGTRAMPEHYQAALKLVPGLKYHELARAIWMERAPKPRKNGAVVVAAGT